VVVVSKDSPTTAAQRAQRFCIANIKPHSSSQYPRSK